MEHGFIKLNYSFIVYVCIRVCLCTCVGHTCVTICVWRLEERVQQSLLPFCHVASGISSHHQALLNLVLLRQLDNPRVGFLGEEMMGFVLDISNLRFCKISYDIYHEVKCS